MGEAVRVTRHGSVLEVVLDRPKANAIDAATSRALNDAWALLRDDDELRVGVLTGGGDRFFSAGWDLKAAAGGEGMDADFGPGGFGGLENPIGLLKPVIAAVNGMAVGGGFELALGADLIIMEEQARFALMEVHHGILAESAAIRLPRRMPYHVAMELMLTGRWMESDEALRWGLVNRVVPAAQSLPAALALAQELAAAAPLPLRAIKDVAVQTWGMTEGEAMAFREQMASVIAVKRSEDQVEGAAAFAEGRDPVWKGR